MAELIERLAGPTIGFSCFDFFVVARETFYDVSLFPDSLCLCSRVLSFPLLSAADDDPTGDTVLPDGGLHPLLPLARLR